MTALTAHLLSGLRAQLRRIDAAAHNLANLQTTGYRAERTSFHDLLYEAMLVSRDRAGRPEPAPIGAGASAWPDSLVVAPGALLETGGPLDLAIEGEGFFQFRAPDGQLVYSRSGQLGIDERRRVVNANGLLLEPPLALPEGIDTLVVRPDGVVEGLTADGASQQLGRLQLARFPNPAGLAQSDAFLLQPTDRSGAAIVGAPGDPGFGTLAQGYLESSNVDLAGEMVVLLQAQRSYQLGLRALMAVDQAVEQANSLRQS